MEKELLFEGKENASSVNIKGFSPEGAKIDINLTGKINGKVAGLILYSHNILMKPGGISELDLRSAIFSNGEPIFVSGKANGKIVDPTPIGKIEGNLTFQTPSQKLSYLNTTKGWSEALQNGSGRKTLSSSTPSSNVDTLVFTAYTAPFLHLYLIILVD